MAAGISEGKPTKEFANAGIQDRSRLLMPAQ
jgi:hypothetical protein